MNKEKILVVDDEVEITEAIEIYLKNEGYDVILAHDGLEALDVLEKDEDIHLIIMDVMMPNLDGIKATMEIRKERHIPIIILSAKSEDYDKILGLQIGADDYVTKPFNPLELVARVKSQLRRYMNYESHESNENTISINGLEVDKESKEVKIDGVVKSLTPIEYKIVELLASNPNRVFSIDDIYENVWDDISYNAENVVAVHIRKIREKLEINPKNPKYIKVVWGLGYKIEK